MKLPAANCGLSKRNCVEAKPAFVLTCYGAVRHAIHPCSKLQGILAKANKKPSLQKKDWVFSYLTLHSPPPKTYCEAHSGRFSGSRIILLGLKSSQYFRPACPFPPCPFGKLRASGSGSGKFRTRLQRRGRPRLSRGSHFGFKPPEYGSIFNYPIPQFLSECQC